MEKEQKNYIQLLPDDVLYTIFKRCRGYKSNISITHCCQRWRFVALNSSKLWTQISLAKPHPIGRLEAWVERSKSSSLNIRIRQPYTVAAGTFDSYLNKWLDVLEKHTDRWGTLFINLESGVQPSSLSRLFSRRYLPRLTALGISTEEEEDFEEMGILQAGAESMPALEELKIWGEMANLLRVDRPGWWACPLIQPGLKELSVRSQNVHISATACLAIVQRCPHLVVLELGPLLLPIEFPSEDTSAIIYEPQADDHIVLPHLRRLYFDQGIDSSILNIITKIRAPKLAWIRCSIPFDLIPTLAAIFPFPFPLLEVLDVDMPPTSSAVIQDLVVILGQLPRLRLLALGDISFGVESPDTTPLMVTLATACPILQLLRLTRCKGGKDGTEALQTVIKARQTATDLQDILVLTIFHSGFSFTSEEKAWFVENVNQFTLD